MPDSFDNEHFQETIRRAAEGDDRAWRTIVDAYSHRVFGLIKSMCGDAELAEEITQSTFCTIVSKIGSYTESGRFESWLFRIATNRFRDEMRRRKRHARPVDSEALTGMAGAAPDEAPMLPDAASNRDLAAALAQLSEADRRIIHLRHCGELSFRQIAELLDEPLGTVLARQHRALKKLRDLMAKDDE